MSHHLQTLPTFHQIKHPCRCHLVSTPRVFPQEETNPFSKMDPCTPTTPPAGSMATYVTLSPLQTAVMHIKIPHTCGDCGDNKRRSHMCKTPLDETPYVWKCWACRDQNHDPDVCRVVLAQMRQHNNGHCQTCSSHMFANWSLVCTGCADKLKWDANWSPCTHGCNRVGLLDSTCQFCMQAYESAKWAERVTQNPWARKTRGCRGCGAEGYDGEYCSRECMWAD